MCDSRAILCFMAGFMLCCWSCGGLAGSPADPLSNGGVDLDDLSSLPLQAGASGPLISEFLAGNASRHPLGEGDLLDQDGDSSDWIEIFNPTQEAVFLDGWFLTDDPWDLRKWRFPPVTLDPGGFLVVFASGTDRAGAGQELHTHFKLDTEGEYLALVGADGATVRHEYAPRYPAQLTGVSYGV